MSTRTRGLRMLPNYGLLKGPKSRWCHPISSMRVSSGNRSKQTLLRRVNIPAIKLGASLQPVAIREEFVTFRMPPSNSSTAKRTSASGLKKLGDSARHLCHSFSACAENSVFLRIFRKILDLVTFFSQKGPASGWIEGLNGLNDRFVNPRLTEAVLFLRRISGGNFCSREPRKWRR